MRKLSTTERDRGTIESFFLRGLDITIALCGLLFLFPVICIISVAIYVSSPGPILFRQIRVGLNCDHFTIYKFRTMFHDPERSDGMVVPDSSVKVERAKFQTTSKNDPRITKIGRLLRRSHLDELPQLWNVVCGDMSIVGPRPDVPVQEADYSALVWRRRHEVRPGVTGLFQIQPQPSTMAVRNASDRYWVINRSCKLYFVVILATFLKILRFDSL